MKSNLFVNWELLKLLMPLEWYRVMPLDSSLLTIKSPVPHLFPGSFLQITLFFKLFFLREKWRQHSSWFLWVLPRQSIWIINSQQAEQSIHDHLPLLWLIQLNRSRYFFSLRWRCREFSQFSGVIARQIWNTFKY